MVADRTRREFDLMSLFKGSHLLYQIYGAGDLIDKYKSFVYKLKQNKNCKIVNL